MRRFLNNKIHNFLIHTLKTIFNYTFNRFFVSTFEDLFVGISNVSFVGKSRARRVVFETDLCRHFCVAHAVNPNFYCILILYLDLNWQDIRLKKLVCHYIKLQALRSFCLPRNKGLICGFDDRPISFSNISFFGLINSHIRVNRLRGCCGINNRGGRTAKCKIHHNIM